MRRLESIENEMRGVVTYEFGDGGRCIAFDAKAVRDYGVEALLRDSGNAHLIPTGRAPIRWHGKIAGTVPATFDPRAILSRSFMYEPRPGDFVRVGDEWVAARTLGPGDLSAVPDFQWSDDPSRADRDVEEDQRILLQAVLSPGAQS